ncbi:MAG: hypothetical protein GX248_05650 [Peptococcaceae bacterium]|nr:hypothetical protein [Peptococcaceae bacterium]
MITLVGVEQVSGFLTKYGAKVYMQSKPNSLVKECVLLNRATAPLKTNILYACTSSELSVLTSGSSVLNILCLDEGNFDDDYWIKIKHNVIVVPAYKETDSKDINHLVNKVRQYLDSYWELSLAQAKLTEILLSGMGLQQIVDTGSELLGNPILVIDISFKVVAYSRTIQSDDIPWQKMTESGYCSYEMIDVMIDDRYEHRYSKFPVYVEAQAMYPYNSQLSGIRIRGKTVGHVSLIECKRPIQECDALLQKFLCEIIACEMQKDSFTSHSKGVMYENFIADLLDGKIKNRRVIKERMKYLDFLKKDIFYILTARLRPEIAVNKPLLYFRDVLETIISGSKCLIYNNDIVALISKSKGEGLSKADFREVIQFLEKHRMIGGLSNSFENVEEAKTFYQQSCKAIELGLRLDSEETLFQYEHYFVYNLFEIAEKQEDLKNFLSPLLFRLMNYDLQNNTDYMGSLYAYLAGGNNLTKAAQVFDIHRNTMNYRIKRIEEILNVNLNDPNVSFILTFSFKLLLFSNYSGSNLTEVLKKLSKL